jgi:hypothetical protein
VRAEPIVNEHFPLTTIVAANPLRDDLTNGIIMRSLFADWPKDRFSHIYFPVAAHYPPDLEFCEESRMIRPSGLVRRFSARRNVTHRMQKRFAVGRTASTANSSWHAFLRRPEVYRWAKFAQEAWYSGAWIRRALEQELRQLRPEIVFSLSGNYCLTKITCQACERLGIPLFLMITDDFVESLYRDLPLKSHLQKVSRSWIHRAIRYASGRAASSPVMAEEYERRYGNRWSSLMTLVDKNAYDPRPRAPGGPLTLVFAGNLGLGRWSILRDLGRLLQSIRDSRGLDVRLRVYAPAQQLTERRKSLDLPPTMELCGWAQPAHLPHIFHNADILVHVESFDSNMAAYTKLSFSAKLCQYMMAGRCILAVGPEDLGSIQMIRRTGAGLTLALDGLQSPPPKLFPILCDAQVRADHGDHGRHWAVECAESKVGCERFRREMLAAVARHRRQHSVGHVKQRHPVSA